MEVTDEEIRERAMRVIADLSQEAERHPRGSDFTPEAIEIISRHMRELRDAVAEPWQPIETAPKHTPILTLCKHGAIEGEWDGETACGYYWRQMEWWPTKWMPLPEPPQTGDAA